MTLALFQNRYYYLAETVLVFMLPLWFLTTSPQLFVFRHIFLLMGFSYIYLITKTTRLTRQDFGVNKTGVHIWTTLLISLLASIALVIIAQVNYPLIYLEEIAQNNLYFPRWAPLVFYVLFSVPLQEFIFRGFYIARLKLVSTHPVFLILASALIFGFVHYPFANKVMPLGTFLLGLWWAYLFQKSKSLIPVIISHTIIGATMIALTLYH